MADINGVYLAKIREVGEFKVWVVDGAKIRRDLDPQFTNFGQPYRFKFIPENEFWIDKEAHPDERRFFIDHLLIECKLMKDGCTYEEAITVADMRESAERMRAKGIKQILDKVNFLPPNSVHEKLLGKTEDGIDVWLVDGKMVRTAYFVDFTEGGHDEIYSFIPEKEVWLDNDLVAKERPFVLLHELFERRLMKKGMDYDAAHEKASQVEWQCRHEPEKLERELLKLGWDINDGKDF